MQYAHTPVNDVNVQCCIHPHRVLCGFTYTCKSCMLQCSTGRAVLRVLQCACMHASAHVSVGVACIYDCFEYATNYSLVLHVLRTVYTTAGKLREALTCQLKEQIAQLEAKDALITRLRSRLENSDALYAVSQCLHNSLTCS
jgi:hypothetical protein